MEEQASARRTGVVIPKQEHVREKSHMGRNNGVVTTFVVWRWEPFTVPVIIALEEGRRPILCAVFPAENESDPVFWRAKIPFNTTATILSDVKWMADTNAFAQKPKPSAVLVGIPADVFFAALSGRLFGDDPRDASGETAAIFRLALTLLPGNPPMDDILAIVGRFRQGAWPLLGMGHIPADVEEEFAHWLPLPELSGAFEIESNNELDELLTALVACPSGHSALHRPALTAPDDGERP